MIMIDYSKIYSIQYIKETLEQLGASMRKGLGQNFIIQEGLIDKIIKAGKFQKGKDTIVEIGPGFGVLSHKLKEIAKNYIAIEKDKKFHQLLSESLSAPNTVIINADVLKIDLRLLPKKYKLISNLPFNIANHIIKIFLEADYKPEMTFLIQKEVAQRIIANSKNQNLLSNSVKFYADAQIIDYVSRDNFWPKPNVDCAIIRIIPKTKQFDKNSAILFFKILKAGFSHPRKQLLNNFCSSLKIDKEQAGDWMKKCKIDPLRRAETLNLDEWICLMKNF